MTIVRRFNNQMPDISNIFDDFFGGDFFNSPASSGRRSVPSVNVRETQDEYEIEVAAPGLNKDDFKVEVNNNVLTISCERDENKEESERGYTRREFCYTGFRRSFAIPRNEVDESKIDAAYKDGILRIKLHKREEVKPKPARMIEIK
ncbi:Hsp20/alpha crystallin family protein [Alkalitalea saponilacus]|uniref:HSP20 family protein n=1 Tax=Alkalitalea saponilacus TaxID=889453 RepID=A0A1T5BWB9_9BACT|nr:Hsp20/alpha crystallin family protein [Alkalitalea saponilacus]ASB49564.1 heat-shock protein [Alkalitalea saponilacus]SKB51632.1 HSP20 family protein [Alkalitalea saponilacus]